MTEVGFARLDITGPKGIFITGYYEPRVAKGTLDPLYASAVAFSDGTNRAVLLSLDLIGIRQRTLDGMRERIARNLGLARKNLLVTCTHTHTGPEVCDGMFPPDPVYNARLEGLMEQVCIRALDDLSPAAFSQARGKVENTTFIRRFRMKDGTVRTNPGYRNPQIDHPIGEADQELRLVRIAREGAPEILLVNFQVHPDTLGDFMGSIEFFSADYPGWVRRTLEGAIENTRVVYLNGTAGDLNHIDVHCPEWDKNGGVEQAMHMGRAIAGEALRIYTKARPVDAAGVDAMEDVCMAPANKGTPEQLPKARQILDWHNAGRDDMLPESGMGITTLVAEAARMLALADAPDMFALNLSVLRVGEICFAGVPGEAFNEVGRYIKAHTPFAVQLICGITNGYEGYFPTGDAFQEGGYEARSSSFKQGVAEHVAESEAELVNALYSSARG